MQHNRYRLASALLAGLMATTLGLGLAHADTLTVDQAQTAFADAGYGVESSTTWDWLAPPVTTFRVYDPARDRELLVLVYSVPAAPPPGPKIEWFSAATSVG